MTVTVIGLGKIGLPLAVQFARKGEQVLGVDINPQTVNLVNAGSEPFPGESLLKEYLKAEVSHGKLRASTITIDCVSKSEVVVVAVPLYVDVEGNPDFSALDSATQEIAQGLKKGTLISYETTLPVGVTRKRFARMIEEISQLKTGIDFHVVFSPERVLTGRVFEDLRKYPKILGGVTSECAQKGFEFYKRVLDFDLRVDLHKSNGVWIMESAESAELVKLAETTYRDVNIALANQFAKYASKISVDINEVIHASNSQIYSHIHRPGISVGGHCIPIYPQFYLWNDPNASLVREARNINSSMPAYCVSKIQEQIGELKDKSLLILGATYRPGVKETAFSGIFQLYEILLSLGAEVQVHDFLLTDSELEALNLFPINSLEEVEIAIIHHDDVRYIEFLKNRELLPSLKYIFDGRNIFTSGENVQGVTIISL
jgi:nucleotide sugar dehydrogenase